MLRRLLTGLAAATVAFSATFALAERPAGNPPAQASQPARSAPQPSARMVSPPAATRTVSPPAAARTPAHESKPAQAPAAREAAQVKPTPPPAPPPQETDCSAGTFCFEQRQAARQQRYEQDQAAAGSTQRFRDLQSGCAAGACSRCAEHQICSPRTQCECANANAPGQQ